MGSSGASEWSTVLDAIEKDLLSGEVRPGDKLPAERALASTLKVRRSSVREALRVLEVLGLIRTQAGSGPESGAIIVASPSGGMGALMRLQVAAQGFRVSDIVRTRLLLEGAVVKELAEHSDDVDLGPLTQLLDAMEDPQLSQPEFLALNAQFHLALADASGNQVVTAVMAGLRRSLEADVFEGADNLADWTATADRLRQEHRDIILTVIEGDGARAATLIQNHISGYYTETHLISSGF
jgi:GntR family transcriptional regulator, transcriptional repressor for pyruvate dehydrogenase complex